MPNFEVSLAKAERAPDTRLQLIDAAERLFGADGIEAVSLRAIGFAAGQANKVAVQYHFADKRSLVAAIFEQRAPAVERRMAQLRCSLIDYQERQDLLSLVSVLFRPVVEKDEDGPLISARFLLNLICSRTYWSVSNVSLARLLFGLEPTGTSEVTNVVRLIGQALPDIPEPVLRQRLCSLARMLLGAVVNQENALSAKQPAWPFEMLLADQLAMIAAALRQPLGTEIARGLSRGDVI